MMLDALRILKPYQLDWLKDQSRFKIGLWCRQSGKDFTASAEAVLDCLRTPNTHWLIVAAGERQALETLRKAADWTRAFHHALASCEITPSADDPRTRVGEITFPNGSRLTALPAKPETIRGYSANLILTEFAFHEKADQLWRAIYPTITNPLRGGPKKIRILSTPNGRANKFHELWSETPGRTGASPVPAGAPPAEPNANPNPVQPDTTNTPPASSPLGRAPAPSPWPSAKTAPAPYTRHRVTIHDAVRQGLPLPIEELRRGLNDPEAWAQEYECEFMDTSSVLLPYDLIHECEDEAALEHSSAHQLSQIQGDLYAGLDFGRKRDLTVCWILQKLGGVLWTREVLALPATSTADQFENLRPRLQRCRRVALDYTGAGVGLGDLLVRALGQHRPGTPCGGKVELCHFTPALKGELFPKLRAAFEARHLRIPISPDIREDLHGLYKTVTPNGHLAYRAAHTPDGHSDRATALALSLHATHP